MASTQGKKARKQKKSAVLVVEEGFKPEEGSDWNSSDEEARRQQSEVENDENPSRFHNENEMSDIEDSKPGEWLNSIYTGPEVKEFFELIWEDFDEKPEVEVICEQINDTIAKANKENNERESLGQIPFDTLISHKRLAVTELRKIRANKASKEMLLKAWDNFGKIRDSWASQVERWALLKQCNFPDGFAERVTKKSMRDLRKAKDHSKTPDPQLMSRGSKYQRVALPMSRGSKHQRVAVSQEASENESGEGSDEDSEVDSDGTSNDGSDEDDYDTDQFDPDVDDSAENLQKMIALVYDMAPSKVVGYRRMGKIGHQVLVEQEQNGARRYRLEPASSVGGFDPTKTLNLATSQRGKITNPDGSYKWTMAHVKRIRAVAWRVSEDGIGVEELEPGPKGTSFPGTDVWFEWIDGVLTWEPRGNVRRIYGNYVNSEKCYRGDVYIHYRAKCQELKYQRALDEARKSHSQFKLSSKHRSQSKSIPAASTRQPTPLYSRQSVSAKSASNRSRRPSNVSFITSQGKRAGLNTVEEELFVPSDSKDKGRRTEKKETGKGKKQQPKQLLSPPASRYGSSVA